MSEISEAVIIGGYAEYEESLWPLANAVSSGPTRLVENATAKTLNWAIENPEELDALTEGKMTLAHSFGATVVRKAGLYIVLNGAEPTSLYRSAVGAIKVKQSRETEEGVPAPNDKLSNRELLSNKRVAMSTPFKVRRASSLQTMIDGGQEAYPDGRLYLPRLDDEFRFGQYGEVDTAREHGITAHMLEGKHNDPLNFPQRTTEEIQEILSTI